MSSTTPLLNQVNKFIEGIAEGAGRIQIWLAELPDQDARRNDLDTNVREIVSLTKSFDRPFDDDKRIGGYDKHFHESKGVIPAAKTCKANTELTLRTLDEPLSGVAGLAFFNTRRASSRVVERAGRIRANAVQHGDTTANTLSTVQSKHEKGLRVICAETPAIQKQILDPRSSSTLQATLPSSEAVVKPFVDISKLPRPRGPGARDRAFYA